MLVHVGAEAGGATIERDLAYQARLHERVEAVIDRGMGNLRHLFFGTDKDFVSSGMIALLHEDVIDLLALGRKTKAVRRQPPAEILIGCLLHRFHSDSQFKGRKRTGQDLE